MKFKTLRVTLLTLLILLLASCSRNEYVTVIPKDAQMVASVDLYNMGKDGDLANSSILRLGRRYMELLLNAKDKATLNGYIEDPAMIGLDFRYPAYMFALSGTTYGITIKVAKQDDVTDFVGFVARENLGTKPKEKDGIRYGNILGEVAYAYDKNAFVLLCSVDGNVKSSERMVRQLMKLDEDDSFVSTDVFAKLSSEPSTDLFVYSRMSILPDALQKAYSSQLPEGVHLSDLGLLTTIDFATGRADVKAEVLPGSDEVSALLEECGTHFGDIKGAYAEKVSKDFLVWACMNCEGDWLLETMKKNETLRSALILAGQGIDIDQMLRSVDGDIALTLPLTAITSDDEDSVPDFILTAQLRESAFLEDVDYWKRSMQSYGMSMRTLKGTNYQLTADGHSFNWGVEGKDLYIATTNAFNANAFTQQSDVLSQFHDEITSSSIFVLADLSAIMKALRIKIPLLNISYEVFRYLVFRSDEFGTYHLSIIMSDEDEHFLKQILK